MFKDLRNNTEITQTESMFRLIIHLIDTQDEEHQQQLFLNRNSQPGAMSASSPSKHRTR